MTANITWQASARAAVAEGHLPYRLVWLIASEKSHYVRGYDGWLVVTCCGLSVAMGRTEPAGISLDHLCPECESFAAAVLA